MAIKDDIGWLKLNFEEKMTKATKGTPLDVDILCAIAVQETGYIWRKLLKKGYSTENILRLCVGDTIDAPRRGAFPVDKAALVAHPRGQEMFELARSLLVEMAEATELKDYVLATEKAKKFCHGYGMFQRDLQFFKSDPDYFLSGAWHDFDRCLAEAVKELTKAAKKLGYLSLPALSNSQLCDIAIVYNTGFGNFDAGKGLKQGFKDDSGKYYGEYIDDYLKISKSVSTGRPEGDVGMNTIAVGMTVGEAIGTGVSAADVAKAELIAYGGIDEGNEPLRSHIDAYWIAADVDPNDFSPTGDPWSAAFISFCIRTSGATDKQFAFSPQHSVFVHKAIKNADAGEGDFRGYRITDYKPKIGDIIQNNRTTSDYSFDYARGHSSYASHSAIVVGFETRSGIPHALTIGGNERDTVGKKYVPLTPEGFVRQRPGTNYYICVIENRMASSAAGATTQALGAYRVVARPDLNLRAGPGTNFPVSSKLKFGTTLWVADFINSADGKWAFVDLENDGGRDGYVFASYLAPA